MEEKALICPSCSGQMKLTEAKPGDKIAKCEYCNTVVDLPDTAEKQGFDLDSLLGGIDLSNLKNSTTTTTTTTTTVIMKNGKVINSTGDNSLPMQMINEILKNAAVHKFGPDGTLTPDSLNLNDANIKVQEDNLPKDENLPKEKKSIFKKLFGK